MGDLTHSISRASCTCFGVIVVFLPILVITFVAVATVIVESCDSEGPCEYEEEIKVYGYIIFKVVTPVLGGFSGLLLIIYVFLSYLKRRRKMEDDNEHVEKLVTDSSKEDKAYCYPIDILRFPPHFISSSHVKSSEVSHFRSTSTSSYPS